MKKFDFDATYFSPIATLDCGQTFRFYPFKDGFFVVSRDKACYVWSDGVKTVIESDDCDYFYNYFDLARDYKSVVERAKAFDIPLLNKCAEFGKGIRILNQDREETIFSFIISQNNNIPRIKSIIEKTCSALGEKKAFLGREYSTFPTTYQISKMDKTFFRGLGAGYRDEFICETAKKILQDGILHLENCDGATLKKELLNFKGVGDKVADCICLFAFGKTENFPVDTWIEKIFREDFGGTIKDRKKINAYFCQLFGADAGIIQQYLFYGKRQNL